MPPEITPGRSLWLRLLHVIEQREDHILRANSLIRQLGSHGFLTDNYLLGPPIRFGEVKPSETVFTGLLFTRVRVMGCWSLMPTPNSCHLPRHGTVFLPIPTMNLSRFSSGGRSLKPSYSTA